MTISVRFAATDGKYRVVCVDTFDGTDWVSGDFDSQEAAHAHAKLKGGTMLKSYVYDDMGNHVANYGSF